MPCLDDYVKNIKELYFEILVQLKSGIYDFVVNVEEVAMVSGKIQTDYFSLLLSMQRTKYCEKYEKCGSSRFLTVVCETFRISEFVDFVFRPES
jgi:hypothetical protein